MTEQGDVFSWQSGEFLTPFRNNMGYWQVQLYGRRRKQRRTIHVLVLEAFVGPRPPGYVACHKNDDKNNNALENLYWGSRTENMMDAGKNGSREFATYSTRQLTDDDVREIRRMLERGQSRKSIAKHFQVVPTSISNIERGRTFKWLV